MGNNLGAPVVVTNDTDNPVAVAIELIDGDINLTGDIIVDTFGALDDPAETDPDAASATIPSLLRGIIEQNAQIIALLTTIEANTA